MAKTLKKRLRKFEKQVKTISLQLADPAQPLLFSGKVLGVRKDHILFLNESTGGSMMIPIEQIELIIHS